MIARTLLDNFDLLAEAPGGIPKLRELILQLAVRGQLVTQDPKDESADRLINRIQSEKIRMVDQRKDSKNILQNISQEEMPFDVPRSWRWVRLADIVSYLQRGKSPKYAFGDGYPVVSQKCVQWRGLDLTSAKLITRESFKDYEAARVLRDGDLLWNSTGTGTIGRIIRINQPPLNLICDSHVTVVRCLLVNPEYIRTWLRSRDVYGTIEDRAAGSTNQVELTSTMALNQVIPLPPLAEQKRIVERVDELMKRCDELEARQNEREEKHKIMVSSCLNALTAPARRDARPPSDDRSRGLEGERPREPSLIIHPSTFNLLFTSPQSVAELRKTILQLAVQGRLVPQDPRDTPPTANFQGIKSVPPEVHLPSSWIVCRYRHLTSLVTSGSRGWKEHYAATGALFIRAQNIKTDALDLRNPAFVLLPERVEGTRSQVKQWDILVTITGSNVTKTALVTEAIDEAYVSQHIALTRPIWSEMAPWLHLCFLSPASVRGELEALAYGAKPGLNLSNIRDLMIPVPPLPEQNRIVAKVNELMALCDTLETKLIQSREDADRFAAAVVNRIDGRTVKLHSKIQSVF